MPNVDRTTGLVYILKFEQPIGSFSGMLFDGQEQEDFWHWLATVREREER